MSRSTVSVRLAAAGFLLLQVVWIFVVPPFRASDEFDHAYRAAAVADGQWVPRPEAATRGTGAWLDVPVDVVDAAQDECTRLSYTGPEDCVGTAVDDETIRIASGAGRYHPLFYEVIGAPASLFEGTTALYVMRAVSSLLCWGMFVVALIATKAWARSRWPFVALTVAATPVLLYSTTVPAPNGLEMTAALALWSALVGLATVPGARHDARLLLVTAGSGALLVTLRSFGPVWAGLVLVTVLLAVPVSRVQVRRVLGHSRGWIALAAVLAATLASVAWIRIMGSLTVGRNDATEQIDVAARLGILGTQSVLWAFQSIAAFPLRNEQSHVSVYGCYLLLAGAVIVLGLRRGSRRLRLGILVTVALSFLVPAIVTFATVETYGTAWQGRYTLPYAVGGLVLVGLALDRRPPRVPFVFAATGGVLYVVAHTVSATVVLHRELAVSPGVDNGAWVVVPLPLLALLAVAGAGLLWSGVALGRDRVDDDLPEEVLDDRSDRGGVSVGAAR